MTILEGWKKWRSRQAAIREFNALDAAQRDELARDTAVAANMLAALSVQGPYRGDELRRLMAALTLDAARVKRTRPAVFRDMNVVCSECAVRRRCRNHLDDGTARQSYQAYCPNAATLGALRHEQPKLWLTV